MDIQRLRNLTTGRLYTDIGCIYEDLGMLTIEEAKELHKQLDSLFCEKFKLVPPAPLVIERNKWQQPYPPYYWYDQGTSNTFISDRTMQGGNEILCSAQGNSGLSVSYCGNAL